MLLWNFKILKRSNNKNKKSIKEIRCDILYLLKYFSCFTILAASFILVLINRTESLSIQMHTYKHRLLTTKGKKHGMHKNYVCIVSNICQSLISRMVRIAFISKIILFCLICPRLLSFVLILK